MTLSPAERERIWAEFQRIAPGLLPIKPELRSLVDAIDDALELEWPALSLRAGLESPESISTQSRVRRQAIVSATRRKIQLMVGLTDAEAALLSIDEPPDPQVTVDQNERESTIANFIVARRDTIVGPHANLSREQFALLIRRLVEARLGN